MVCFGFKVTAKDAEAARKKAKFNLKPFHQRKNSVEEFSCREIKE